MKLEIRAKSPGEIYMHSGNRVCSNNVEVFLDGVNIGKHCRAVDFRIAVDSIVTATIEFMPDELIVDAEVLAIKKQSALPDVTQEAVVNLISDAIVRNMGGLKTLIRDT